ncbi:FAD/NAD(P)-binding protein [Massilia sp. TS11]|uniref:FAD/NAD(P)-binding protein n=1 Tax=Massilia sp. TS11 TaxID=2908003 RepID=UPI001EDA4882|nr:FAD/NAD(P)-binding domain-containing protein [Massilia sp. TS11]MCG2584895.1 FAD/NAD(P)-binding protein [Massilia sp. TS11]
MKRTRITLIGMGPRGLSVLERLLAFARVNGAALELHLVEPGACGPGAHWPQQADYLLINTVASQVTIFPWREAVAHPCPVPTPSLTEWARAEGYRRIGSRFVRAAASDGAPIEDGDYLPRCLLGEYLDWAFRSLLGVLPPTCRLRHHRHQAADVRALPGGGYQVELDSGYCIASDYLFLCTGHCRNQLNEDEDVLARFAREHVRYNDKLAYVRQPYPMAALERIASDASVAVQGLGLTAQDVLASLSVGRGGRFQRVGQRLCYARSGLEPAILLFSRHCLPAAARGINQKGLSGRYQPHWFTRAAIAGLRQRFGPQLDFDRALLPLLLKEMGYAWRCAHDGRAPDPARYTLGAAERQAIEGLLFPLAGRSFAEPAAFASFFQQLLSDDLREAKRGNCASPLKACADVLRDVRASLQEAVEFGGLTPASHRRFLSLYNPIINRISFGPPRQRNAELLALLDAGVVRVAAGPQPSLHTDSERAQFLLRSKFPGRVVEEGVDVLLVARLDPCLPEQDSAPLMQNLLQRGLVRPYCNGPFHPGGIDIDRAGHPIGRDGQAQSALWALGYLTEGAHYYTHALPRPGLASRAVQDADRAVRELFSQLEARQTHRGPAAVAADETL